MEDQITNGPPAKRLKSEESTSGNDPDLRQARPMQNDDNQDATAEQRHSEKQENPSESRRKSIQRCIQALVHACQCRDANCRLHSCQKMKRVLAHTKSCRRKTSGDCPICKQLIALCCYYAKHCNVNKCLVPFCQQLKQKLRQQQLQQRLHQAQMLRRRMALMAGNQNVGSSTSATTSSAPTTNGDVDMAPQPASQSSNMQGGSYSMGGKAPGPPQGAMKAAMEAQEMAQIQARQVQNTSKASMPTNSTGKPSMAGMQPQPHQQAVSVMGGAGQQQVYGPALSQLLQTLKSQNPPHSEVLALLKKNPALMAQVLKLKTQRMQQQQISQQPVQSVQMQQPVQQQIKTLPPNIQGMAPQQAVHPNTQQQQQHNQQQQQLRYQMMQQMRQQQLQQRLHNAQMLRRRMARWAGMGYEARSNFAKGG